MYEIVDRKTGTVVATVRSLAAARRGVDLRDRAYGAYRYFARPRTTLQPALAQAERRAQ